MLNPKLLSMVLSKNPLEPVDKFRLESDIAEKFGMEGVRFYLLINGKRSVEEMIARCKLKEDKLLSLLRFMKEKGAIDVEDSLLQPPSLPAPKTAEEKEVFSKYGEKGLMAYRLLQERKPPSEVSLLTGLKESHLLEIMDFIKVEEKEFGELPAISPEEREAVESPHKPVVIPVKKKAGLFTRLKSEAELIKRFGQKGIHLQSLIDGKKTSIRLAKETGYPLRFIDDVLDFLSSSGALELVELDESGIRENYGEEGLAIYEVYGRDGLLIYDMIDKRTTIKEVIMKSGVPPKKGVEIFLFIHKILGLEIPLDRRTLYRELGIEK